MGTTTLSSGNRDILTWSEKPTASEFGVGQAWFSDLDAMGYSDGNAWINSTDVLSNIAIQRAANESLLVKIRKRIYGAAQGDTLNYIVSGDSTRATPTVDVPASSIAIEYYRKQLSKLGAGMTVFHNALSGNTAAKWLDGTATVTWALANAQISGTGANSILEFSFGINDWSTTPVYATVKNTIKSCIDTMLAAKPDLAILLVSPVRTGSEERNAGLEQIYIEVANEYQLPMISGYYALDSIYSTPGYYTDATHPNEFGLKRLINYILDGILPASTLSKVTLEELMNADGNLAGALLIDKTWSTGTGAQSTSEGWRILPEFAVKGATTLLISHQGNRRDVVCMDSGGVFIKRISIDSGIVPDRPVYLPYNTATVRINISSQGGTYDALNDIINIRRVYMPVSLINNGLILRNTVSGI
jgi:hypothetical protein